MNTMVDASLRVIPAALAAAVIAYRLNALAVGRWGGGAVGLLVPAIEELCKTGGACLLGAPIALVHILFGAMEAVYDGYTAGQVRWAAAALSLAGHAVFGALTGWTAHRRGLPLAMLAAWILHALWNSFTLRMAENRE
ncbi:MAG: hypothetical protein ACOYCE_11380 [Limnochordia bacterium]|nr:hypothetical protein [Bacillota bacterium]